MQRCVLGVTGPIAAGKDAVTDFFVGKGFAEIDVDRIGHQITQQKLPQLQELFGSEILAADGTLDRRRLGRIVFSDPGKLALLNSAVHPEMVAEVVRLIEAASASVAVNCALLYQMGLDRFCTAVVFVTAPEEERIARIVRRNGMSTAEAAQRVKSQKDINRYLKCADAVIENQLDRESLIAGLETLYSTITGGCADGTAGPQTT